MAGLSDWDIDFRDGQAGENAVAKLLSIETVEVKTDRRYKETGNLYVEVMCFKQSQGAWVWSGLAASKASHWAFHLEEITLLIDRATLVAAVKTCGREIECNLEPNPSRGYLIRPEQMFEYIRQISDQTYPLHT